MQERTRSQMLEDIVANLANHAETGQIPKPYRRGSWRPIGHMRPSSPLLDSVRDQFEGKEKFQWFPFFLRECATFSLFFLILPPLPSGHQDYDQLAKDFTRVFLNIEPSCLQNAHLFDVVFLVGQSKQKARFIGVRAILGVRSRVFQVNNPTITKRMCFSKIHLKVISCWQLRTSFSNFSWHFLKSSHFIDIGICEWLEVDHKSPFV